MDSPMLARVAIIVGALLVLISLFADPLGLGRSPGFGWIQTLGGRRRCSGDSGRGLSVVASESSGERVSVIVPA